MVNSKDICVICGNHDYGPNFGNGHSAYISKIMSGIPICDNCLHNYKQILQDWFCIGSLDNISIERALEVFSAMAEANKELRQLRFDHWKTMWLSCPYENIDEYLEANGVE